MNYYYYFTAHVNRTDIYIGFSYNLTSISDIKKIVTE